ncbi:MAG TPA: HD domain-containing protein [Actinobacteria bacterium]|nr:HD domain-containing protein [Actinomycetota bacterium]
MVKMRLRWKLGVAGGLLIFVLVGAMTYFSVQWQKNRCLEWAKEKNFIIANSLKYHVENFLEDEVISLPEEKYLFSYAHSLNQDFVCFHVVDKGANILFSLDAEEKGEKDEDECLRSAIEKREIIEQIWVFIGEESEKGEVVESFGFFDRRTRAQEIVMPFFVEGELSGAIHIYVNLVEFAEVVDTIYLRSFLLALVVILVSLFLQWVVLSKFVYRPIEILKCTAQQVEKGDFKKRAKILSKDEFGELFEACNKMTRKFSSLINELGTSQSQAKSCVASVGRALGSSLNEKELLETILDAATGIIGAEKASLMMLNEKKDELTIKAAHGLSDEVVKSTKLKLGDGISGWVAKKGEPLLLINGINDPRFQPIQAKEGTKDAIVVPLKVRSKIIGVLNITNKIGDKTFDDDDLELLTAMANEAAVALENTKLYQEIRNNFFGVIRALAEAVDAKDTYTRGHADRVTEYAVAIAEEMGLSESEREQIKVAAILHDIGKIGIGEQILLKPGKFTFDEMLIIQTHPLIGANILVPIEFPWDIISLVRHHHERYDGLGYPGGLSGEEIPLGARIITVADCFEAMTSNRPYHRAKMATEAIEEVKKNSGTQFDPDVVEAFLLAFERGKIKIFSEEDFYWKLLKNKEEERRAIRETFVNITNSLLKQYAKIGGSKLVQNIEVEVKKYILNDDLNLGINNGKIEIVEMDHISLGEEIDMYKRFLSNLAILIKRSSGVHLLNNLLSVSLGDLSERLKIVANHHLFNRPLD